MKEGLGDRKIFSCAIGDVHSFLPSEPDGAAVCLMYYGRFSHVGERKSYISSSHYFTAADARNVAAALIKAADFADAGIEARRPRIASRADLGLEVA